jgi:hypothetical protein
MHDDVDVVVEVADQHFIEERMAALCLSYLNTLPRAFVFTDTHARLALGTPGHASCSSPTLVVAAVDPGGWRGFNRTLARAQARRERIVDAYAALTAGPKEARPARALGVGPRGGGARWVVLTEDDAWWSPALLCPFLDHAGHLAGEAVGGGRGARRASRDLVLAGAGNDLSGTWGPATVLSGALFHEDGDGAAERRYLARFGPGACLGGRWADGGASLALALDTLKMGSSSSSSSSVSLTSPPSGIPRRGAGGASTFVVPGAGSGRPRRCSTPLFGPWLSCGGPWGGLL